MALGPPRPERSAADWVQPWRSLDVLFLPQSARLSAWVARILSWPSLSAVWGTLANDLLGIMLPGLRSRPSLNADPPEARAKRLNVVVAGHTMRPRRTCTGEFSGESAAAVANAASSEDLVSAATEN